ncbi:J domain-containing protein [Penicillium taxi]|uniref:J domain-containing protein n=1 Tax=Penicillium taxi TaxID=168475 RepID=UPI00254580FB|nr:J domain-containing protein [Penicillium taxi]KAJ5907759.1 J domain-containing protein [Penicillium taxi]
MSSAKASGSDANNGSAKSRDNGTQDRKVTPEQKKEVLRILGCGSDFYVILGVDLTKYSKSEVTKSVVRKEYMKRSLLVHPDKNVHDRAAEAFKRLSHAAEVLMDADKKAHFDRFGADPDDRSSGRPGPASAGASPFGGGFGGGGGGGFAEEISPEELFSRFFTGAFGGGGGGFNTFGGQQFAFNMGGPGIRVHQFGGATPRRRPRNAAGDANPSAGTPPDAWTLIRQLLPLLVLFILPLLSSLFSGSSTPSGPTFRFNNVDPYTQSRTTSRLNVNYFVNPTEMEDHSPRKVRQLDQRVEVEYVNSLKFACDHEIHTRDRKIQDAQGWFFPDVEKMREARAMELNSCNRLNQLKGRY